jgi:beta-glucosidase
MGENKVENYTLDWKKYAALARLAVAEGCVLLENKAQALPLKQGEKIAVYGRSAFRYYKSGLGSGGLVNTAYVVGILDALKASKEIRINQELLEIYENWLKENPYDEGQGWGRVPWSQKEMPITKPMLEIAKKVDASLIFIGRTAGEDQDNSAKEGSYHLTKDEERLIEQVCEVSKRTIAILNVGNIIDMNWVEKYHPQAVLYVWQGGQEGGNGTLDVLLGNVVPCGKLTDTIAREIEDYASTSNFGDAEKNYYKEDIYVGYRYFETFAKEKVLYPFGYGMSYTDFGVKSEMKNQDESCVITIYVKNIGNYSGKETVQVYVNPPQGKLGKPLRQLVGFAKTKQLLPEEEEILCITVNKDDLTSYDDSGVTGHKSCYVLEEGAYEFYVGTDVRSAVFVGVFEQKLKVVKQLESALAPVEPFKRMKPVSVGDTYEIQMEEVPLQEKRNIDDYECAICSEIPYTGDKGMKLVDVLDQKASLDEFVAQLDENDLIHMFRGEGMCSPRVTPGTAAAFGGITDKLQEFGIPVACCADGPSGIRMDCGTKAFSLPNGTALGCTFNTELVGQLFAMLGKELRLNNIDSLLGPGMNLHRNPLNGRNFEYISEDPYITGKIAAAQVKAMCDEGIGTTIKHFCGNNQEVGRNTSDSVISERALREIYLKGFEMAVKEGQARSVMTTYGSVNGCWTAGSYDLCTKILREQWGFDGIVMTDWWAQANYPGEKPNKTVKAPMVKAQNDIYMCVAHPEDNPEKDDVKEKLESGYLTKAELQRNAKNILGYLLKSQAILRFLGRISKEEQQAIKLMAANQESVIDPVFYHADSNTHEIVIPGNQLHPKAGESDVFAISADSDGEYSISITLKSELGNLAQLPISVFFDNVFQTTVSIQGTAGKVIEETRDLCYVFGSNHYVKLYYGANGLAIEQVALKKRKDG